MKIFRWIIYLFYCWSGILAAQENLIFRDPFDNPAYRWSFEQDMQNMGIANGQMHIQSTLSEKYGIAYHELLLQNGSDFRLHSEIHIQADELNFEAGICWSVNKDRSSYYAFLVKSGGYFSVIAVRDQKVESLIPWTRHKKLKNIDEAAVSLSIHKRGWQLYFEVNGKKVGQIPYQKLMGKYHGFILKGNGELYAEHFTVYHPPLEINLTEESLLRAHKAPLDTTVNPKRSSEVSPYLSENRQELYFLRWEEGPNDHKSGLYKSVVQGDSMWSQPEWLGVPTPDKIRTMGKLPLDVNIPPVVIEEQYNSYCLSKDRQLLIIAMEHKDGYGEQDLYIIERRNGKWSAPVNLGPDINTFATECSPFLSPDNQTLYFSSSGHPGYGETDVFVARRTSNTWTRWTEAVNLGPNVNGPTQDEDFLPFSSRHAYMATVDSIHGDFDLYGIRIPLNLRQGETIQLENVFFHRASADLLESSFEELDKLVFIMINNPKLEIEIRGHTDNIGFEDELLLLSEERAETVRNYLVSKGVSASRMRFRGYGSSVPIASNDHPETRKLNRRVEFFIIKR